MATIARSGTLLYSGVTTTTDTDILTLTGANSARGGKIKRVRVQNTHATASLVASTSGATAVGDGAVKILAGKEAILPVRTAGNATVTVHLTGSAACDYNVMAEYV
jgi:hypothetical protein